MNDIDTFLIMGIMALAIYIIFIINPLNGMRHITDRSDSNLPLRSRSVILADDLNKEIDNSRNAYISGYELINQSSTAGVDAVDKWQQQLVRKVPMGINIGDWYDQMTRQLQ